MLAQTFDDPSRLGLPAQRPYLGDDTATHDFYGPGGSPGPRHRRARPAPVSPGIPRRRGGGRRPLRRRHGQRVGGLRLARETGQESSVCRNLSTLALLAAMQGHEDACRSYAAEALENAVPRGLRLQAASATWALALLDLASSRPAEALARLETLTAGSETGHPVIALLSVPDLVEAAVRANQTERGQTALAGFEQWATHTAPPWALALVPRCRGLLSAPARPPTVTSPRRYGCTARAAGRSTGPAPSCSTARPSAVPAVGSTPASTCAPLTTFEQLGASPGRSGHERSCVQRRDGAPARPQHLDQLTPRSSRSSASSAKGRPTARSQPSSS